MHRPAWSRFGGGPTEPAFTLVELAIVMLIIAMLIAIAVPTFLGARSRAQDRAAQTSIRNVFASAKVIHTDAGDYRNADVSALSAAEPSVQVVGAPTPSTDENVVSIYAPDATTWYATAISGSGGCFALRDRTVGGTGTSYAIYVPADVSQCNPIWASTGPPVVWTNAWP